MAKAHSMVVQLLRLPTLDNVMGLLILSWAEFGQVSERFRTQVRAHQLAEF
jgi:hypothetical protein